MQPRWETGDCVFTRQTSVAPQLTVTVLVMLHQVTPPNQWQGWRRGKAVIVGSEEIFANIHHYACSLFISIPPIGFTRS